MEITLIFWVLAWNNFLQTNYKPLEQEFRKEILDTALIRLSRKVTERAGYNDKKHKLLYKYFYSLVVIRTL